ncbi:MAG TPA: hypothetical protein VKB59_19165 [Micromonosporaceae bacterium]|nr:hypothetical protein [Micromonosporaceae bacterium]
MRVSRAITVIAVSCLIVSACGGPHAKPTSSLGHLTASAANTAPTANATPSAPATIAPTVSTTTSGPTPPPNTPLRITVRVDRQNSVDTADCPYTFTFHGRITVNKGPVDVSYHWQSSQGGPGNTATVHFGGAGQQTATLSTQLTEALVNQQLSESLVLAGVPYDHSHAATTFTLACGAKATTPVADPTHGQCPYQADFSSVVSVAVGPQDVTVVWTFSQGAASASELHFTGTGPQSVTIGASAEVDGLSLGSKFTARVSLPTAGGTTTAPASVTCDLVNH